MRAETKKAKLAALLGIELPTPPTKQELQEAATRSREAEAVLAYADGKINFIQRECKWCEFVFAVNRSSIAYCSDTCRKHALKRDWHMDWDPDARTLEERWSPQTGGPEPLIVGPSVLPLIQEAMVLKAQEAAHRVESLIQEHLPAHVPEQSLDELLSLSDIGDLSGLLD